MAGRKRSNKRIISLNSFAWNDESSASAAADYITGITGVISAVLFAEAVS